MFFMIKIYDSFMTHELRDIAVGNVFNVFVRKTIECLVSL